MNAPRNTKYRYLDVQKIAGSLGADVRGVDLSQDVPDEVLAEIRAALLDNLVIAIRDQDDHASTATGLRTALGRDPSASVHGGDAEEYPEILAIIKRPTDKKNFGGSWHTDQMFSPTSGDGHDAVCARRFHRAAAIRLFTNQYLAYESLSDGMKSIAASLRTVCVGDNFKAAGGLVAQGTLCRPNDRR